MLRLILLKTFYLTIGVFLVALIGSIANGWLLFSIWLIFTAFRFSYLSIENIRAKLNTKKSFNSVIMSIIFGVFHTELKFQYFNAINSYRIIYIQKTAFISLVGAVICILNVISKGMWARDFLSIFQQKPVESVAYLLLISLIFSLLENTEETKLEKLKKTNRNLSSSEGFITNKLSSFFFLQWLLWILIAIFTVFIIRTVS